MLSNRVLHAMLWSFRARQLGTVMRSCLDWQGPSNFTVLSCFQENIIVTVVDEQRGIWRRQFLCLWGSGKIYNIIHDWDFDYGPYLPRHPPSSFLTKTIWNQFIALRYWYRILSLVICSRTRRPTRSTEWFIARPVTAIGRLAKMRTAGRACSRAICVRCTLCLSAGDK